MKPVVAVFALMCLAACGGREVETEAPQSPAALHLIGAVQGALDKSPMLGQTVTVHGVVTGDFQNNDADPLNNLGGFFITGAGDANDQTSDGIFVFEGDSSLQDVSPGDTVEVTGRVLEYFGETQLQPERVSITGRGSVITATVSEVPGTTLNSDGELIPDLERYEGMLVRFDETLTVSSVFQIERFGELLLSTGGRLLQFTNTSAPSVEGFAEHQRDIARRSLLLDDGRRGQNERPAVYVDAKQPVRVGDEVRGLSGVLRYSRGSGGAGQQNYRLMPTDEVVFSQTNPRPDAPARRGSLRVAALNTLNFFTTPDSGAEVCGPRGMSGCRGADSQSELQRQQKKLVATLRAIDADIVGLVELENNADASLRAIVGALNDGDDRYAFIDTGTIGDDAIKVGLIYRPEAVRPIGDFAILDRSVDASFIDTKNRPVLAQTFTTQDGGAVTVAVNHLKSKGSDCDELGDPDRPDGQGDCNLTRKSAAAAMAAWLNSDPTGSGDPDILIIGDLNAYHHEDPVTAITDRGYENLVEAAHGTQSYSFVFRGQSGALDHAFGSTSLVPQVSGAMEWHVNADESPLFDYNEEFGREARWFDGDSPYRSSDHDPLIIDLRLESWIEPSLKIDRSSRSQSLTPP